MKTVKFLLAIFTVGFVLASCATTQRGYEEEMDDDTRRIGNRVYVDDPYYGTVVLERDPFTGRYYDVTRGSRGYYPAPYNRYNNYSRGYRNYPRSYNSHPRSYNNSNSGTVQKPSQEQIQKNREEARNKVLGNN